MKLKNLFLVFLVIMSTNLFSQKISNDENFIYSTNSVRDTPTELPFFDDFEDGDYSDYNDLGGTTVTEVTDITAANGTYSLHIDGGSFGNGVTRSLIATTPEYISFYVMSGNIGGAAAYFDVYSGATDVIRFAIDDVQGPSVWQTDAWQGVGSSAENNWYFVEFKNINFASETFDFYVDESLLYSNLPFRNSASNVDGIELHNFSDSEGYYDDIYIQPPNNNALNFDGTDNVSCTLPSLFDDLTANSFSVEAIIESSSSAFCRVWFAQSTTSNFATLSLASDNRVFFYVYGGDNNYSVNTTTSLDGVTLVSCTYDASTNEALVYYDGVLQNLEYGNNSSTTSDNSMTIGAKTDFSQPYTGTLDELRIWDHVRTNCDILNNMSNEVDYSNPGLVAYYTFNHGLGGDDNTTFTTLSDVTGNGYDGTLNTFSLIGSTSNWISSPSFYPAYPGPTPDVAVLEDIISECSVDLTSYTVTATDVCGSTINGIASQNIFDEQGTYSVTWIYDNGNGGVSTQTQSIVIEDMTAPVADVAVLDDVIGECDATVTFTPTATDNCEGMIYATTIDALYYDMQGVYTVTWTYDDGNGNTTTQDQTVIVEDMTAPTITCVENQIIDLTEGQTTYSVTGTEFDAIADDNCTVASFENDLNMTSSLAGEELMPGTYSVTWTAMDAVGNMEICTMEIVVNPYVGLQSIDNINVSVYPNPTSGVLNITNAEGYKVVITDVSGRTIQTVEANTDNLKVDLSNNADGMYFIQFINNGVVSTVKIIKK